MNQNLNLFSDIVLIHEKSIIQDYWERKDTPPHYKVITLDGKKGFLNVYVKYGKPIQYQASTITEDCMVYVLTVNWVKEEERQKAMNTLFVMMNSFSFVK